LRVANSWVPDSRLRTDRPTVTWVTPSCPDNCRSWEAVQATATSRTPAAEEKRRVANRRANRGSEAHDKPPARQVVTSKMGAIYSRTAASAVTQITLQCALRLTPMCGPLREILIANKKAAFQSRGFQHIELPLATTTPLLGCFLLG
jgi:hypothetical protein